MTGGIGSVISDRTACVAIAIMPALASSTIALHRNHTWLDRTHDVIVDRAFVPSERRPQGEIRVIRRGERVVVQTLLYTRLPNRVFAAIREKERHNWPPGVPEHDDMESYVAALEDLRRAATMRKPSVEENDRRLEVLIEFVDAPDATSVVLGDIDLEEQAGVAVVQTSYEPKLLQLSMHYVRRNMRLIVADAFHVSMDEAEALLSGAAAPRASPR